MKPGRRAQIFAVRRRILVAAWIAATAAILARASQLQLVQGDEWRAAALQQHRTSSEVPASRGTIVDRDGVPLALTRERVRVAVAPDELVDREQAVRLLREVLGLPARLARDLTEPTRTWSVAPGRYAPAVRERLAGVRGIHLEPEMERFYPRGDLARGVLGTVLDGAGQGGIEQRYEPVLRGRPGREIVALDNLGQEIPGEAVRVEEPVARGVVRLTLDLGLQEIAHQVLGDALARTGARGGDLVVTDPHTGEVLALVSMQGGRVDALSAINAPYEPGSTIKPFTVAGLLARGLATLEDSVETAGGSWTVNGRTISDVHAYEGLTLAEALLVSSNVGVARAAQAYTPGAQYETLRDFGFGAPTGVELPGEVGGTLRRPDQWSDKSAVSLAIGYEISVTPLQMALAYGALANGGMLLEPWLVAEVLDVDGVLLEQRRPRTVRRVIPTRVARQLAGVLEDVVEYGTATAARLETFLVAGKTGTTRAHAGGHYVEGRYYSSFVGFFPADDPQLVVFVKLDSPDGAYYGGATAAPVTRAMVEGALAARGTPLDRTALLRSFRRPESVPAARPASPEQLASVVRFAALTPEASPGAGDRGRDWAGVPPWAGRPPTPPERGPALPDAVSVPELAGLTPRSAARRLHALGFRVRWEGDGTVRGTTPPPGARLAAGDTVTVHGTGSVR